MTSRRGTSGGSNEPASPEASPSARQRADEIGQRADAHIVEQSALALMRGVQHRAMKAGAGERLKSVEIGAEIGEEHGDELRFRGQRRQRLDDLVGVGRRRQGEFHVIDAGRDDLFKVAQRMRDVVRQFDDGADRTAAVDEGDDVGDVSSGRAPSAPREGVLAVDDVGAAREGDLRLGAGENAGQHQGHEFLAPVVAQRASARLWSKFFPNPSGLARLPSCSRWAPPDHCVIFSQPQACEHAPRNRRNP